MRLVILLSFLVYSCSAFAQVPPSDKGYRIGDGDIGIPEGTGKPYNDHGSVGVYQEGKKYGFYINNKREPAMYDQIQSANGGFIVKKNQ
ncbi:MAG: hypothetical protein EOP54_07480, partial [Sphingobacteriales bacterium]